MLMVDIHDDLRHSCPLQQGATAATKRGAPICYDFVKGMCSRGDECRYSHDITSVMNSSKARPAGPVEPCFDFLRCESGMRELNEYQMRLQQLWLTQQGMSSVLMPSALHLRIQCLFFHSRV